MKLWELPSHYAGAEWPDHYVFLSRNRESDDLTESNFAVGLKRLNALPPWNADESVWDSDGETAASRFAVRESHWACGWIEWIAVHKLDAEGMAAAEKMEAALKEYPVLDENDWSAREQESAERVWRNCYDAGERVEYIREHRGQFEFREFAELLACVRGKYFAGYASDLLC